MATRKSKLAPASATGTAPKKVVEVEKTHEKVWNLSDWPGKGNPGNVMMIAGKNVHPGRAIRVPVEKVEKSKLLKKMEESGSIYIGQTPPKEYLAAKNRITASVPKTHARSHGPGALPKQTPDVDY